MRYQCPGCKYVSYIDHTPPNDYSGFQSERMPTSAETQLAIMQQRVSAMWIMLGKDDDAKDIVADIENRLGLIESCLVAFKDAVSIRIDEEDEDDT